MTWVIFALMSVFALAGSELSQKISLVHKANVSAITNNFTIWILQGLGGIIIAIALGEFNLSVLDFPFFRLLLVGLIYFAGGTLYYTSYKANSPSVSIILASISVVISSFLGILLFRESTNVVKFAGIFLILVSIVFINIKKKNLRMDIYNLYALLGGVCFGIAFTIDKSFVLDIPASIYLTYMCFSVAFVSFFLKGRLILDELKGLKSVNYLNMLRVGFFGTLFNYFTFSSYKLGGNVGVLDALNNSAVFIVIVLEILILKDKTNLKKKILASALAVAGVYLLSLVK